MNINTILSDLINGLMVGLLSLGVGYLTYYIALASKNIKAKTASIKDEQTRNTIDKVLDVLTNLIDINVESAQNTIVKELKQTTVDGKLDVDDAKNVLSIVKGKVIAQLSDSGKQALSTIINDLEGYIESKIEVSLKNLKAKDGVTDATTIVSDTIDNVGAKASDSTISTVQSSDVLLNATPVVDSASENTSVDNQTQTPVQ